MNGYSADLKQVCGCSWAATGATADEVVSKTKAHARQTHNMTEVPAEIAQKLQAAMRPTM
jgi:predicted small metal-binding protein